MQENKKKKALQETNVYFKDRLNFVYHLSILTGEGIVKERIT